MNRPDNHETPIANFTLTKLLAMAGEKRQGLMQECIAVNSESQMDPFRFPSRIDAFVIGIGTEGESVISHNLREYTLKKDSLFISTPQSILQVQSKASFRAHVLVISPELMRERINIDTKYILPLLLQFGMHPSIEISAAESQELRNFIRLIEQEVQGGESLFARDIICALIAATIYKLGDILHHYLDSHPEKGQPGVSRAEEYFTQFMNTLNLHYKQERSVGFYARQLCITPKYLTTLVKRVSGKSVSEWIDGYVIAEAKTLLKYSTMSVQEIAYHLNFANQSFFGSYFKRITGMSPSAYKDQK